MKLNWRIFLDYLQLPYMILFVLFHKFDRSYYQIKKGIACYVQPKRRRQITYKIMLSILKRKLK